MRFTSSSGKDLAESLRLPEVLVIEPPSGLGMLGLCRRKRGRFVGLHSCHRLIPVLLLLRCFLVENSVEEGSGRLRLELEIAVSIADDPWNEELRGRSRRRRAFY